MLVPRREHLALAFLLDSASGCGARTELSSPGLDANVSPTVPCTTGTFALRRANPALMFVIDRSRSMLEPAQNATGRSRWRVLSDALANTLPPVDGSVELGALVFPVQAASQGTSCLVAGKPDLLPALNQANALLSLLRDSSPAGSTPTADAIDVAATALLTVRAARSARALVLATDGAPDCNNALDPKTCTCVEGAMNCTPARCLDDQRTVSRIRKAADAGLPTYVIGIQDPNVSALSAAALDAMALAGQRPQPGGVHHYYAASSEGELQGALTRIRDEVGSCTYLTSSVPDAEGTISVNVNGVALAFDESRQTGWSWVARNNGEILLAPDACALLSSGNVDVEATLTCASP